MSAITETTAAAARTWIFDRVLVGIDESPESLEAARQAAIFATGPVALFAAYSPTHALAGAGMAPVAVHYDESPFRENAEHALERAVAELHAVPASTRVAKGRAWEELLHEIVRRDYSLVAVGSHGAGRARGILIGSTATELIHKAPCSVLIARKPLQEFPSSIVVGVDDSVQGQRAGAVAGELAARLAGVLDRRENLQRPVESLVEAAMEADLLVVGSRGLSGVKALGSVSERVAHEAKCSVLIVR